MKAVADPGVRLRALRAGSLAAEALGVAGAAATARVREPEAGGETPAASARGVVASVHRRAVNLRLDSGALVAVLPETSPLHPWAVTAAFDPADLAPGMPVHIASAAPPGGEVALDPGGAIVVDLRLRQRPRRVRREAVAWLNEGGSKPAADDPFEPAIAGAVARFRTGGGIEPLLGLVGLGPGLTPSGDDVVTGVLAGLDLLREADPPARDARDRLAAGLTRDVLDRTPVLSAQMLRAAVRGLHAEPVLALLLALQARSAPHASLAEASKRVLALGHRSGAETLRGIAAALGLRRTPTT